MASSVTSAIREQTERQFRVVVAADDSAASMRAIGYAAMLCQQMMTGSVLQVVHAISLNPEGSKFFGPLDRTNNLEIKQDAQGVIEHLRALLKDYDDLLDYQLIVKESQETVGQILETFVNKDPPDMLLVGSNNREGIQKWALGSVSEHCVHRCHCPVTVVK